LALPVTCSLVGYTCLELLCHHLRDCRVPLQRVAVRRRFLGLLADLVPCNECIRQYDRSIPSKHGARTVVVYVGFFP
jgi:hypothetical protein